MAGFSAARWTRLKAPFDQPRAWTFQFDKDVAIVDGDRQILVLEQLAVAEAWPLGHHPATGDLALWDQGRVAAPSI